MPNLVRLMLSSLFLSIVVVGHSFCIIVENDLKIIFKWSHQIPVFYRWPVTNFIYEILHHWLNKLFIRICDGIFNFGKILFSHFLSFHLTTLSATHWHEHYQWTLQPLSNFSAVSLPTAILRPLISASDQSVTTPTNVNPSSKSPQLLELHPCWGQRWMVATSENLPWI